MKKVVSIVLCIAMAMSICGCRLIDGALSSSSSDDIEILYEEITVGENGEIMSSVDQPTTSQDNTDDTTGGGEVTTPQNSVSIDYNTAVEIDICDDIVRSYLNATTPQKQFYWLNEYSGSSHDFQNVELEWRYDGSTMYTVTFSENADFSNPHIITTNMMTLLNTTFVPGKTYYWKATGTISSNPLGGGKITIKNAPVRWIKIEGTGNVRDMGGWKTESGKTVKYEKLYRGQALDNISDAGKETVKRLGFKTEIDIRHTGNDRKPPNISGMKYQFLSTTMQYDGIFSTNENSKAETSSNYKKIFELISNENNYPIYTHCSAGADRTGTYAFLLNGLLGVSYEDLTRDFELTSFSSSGKRWRGSGDGNTFGPNDLEMKIEGNYVAWGKLYNEMMTRYGTSDGKLSTAIERYLVSYCGVPKAQIDSFKAIMLG